MHTILAQSSTLYHETRVHDEIPHVTEQDEQQIEIRQVFTKPVFHVENLASARTFP